MIITITTKVVGNIIVTTTEYILLEDRNKLQTLKRRFKIPKVTTFMVNNAVIQYI
jgi:hypothetical protein